MSETPQTELSFKNKVRDALILNGFFLAGTAVASGFGLGVGVVTGELGASLFDIGQNFTNGLLNPENNARILTGFSEVAKHISADSVYHEKIVSVCQSLGLAFGAAALPAWALKESQKNITESALKNPDRKNSTWIHNIVCASPMGGLSGAIIGHSAASAFATVNGNPSLYGPALDVTVAAGIAAGAVGLPIVSKILDDKAIEKAKAAHGNRPDSNPQPAV